MIKAIIDIERDNDGTFSIDLLDTGRKFAKIYASEFIYEDGCLSIFNECGYEIISINELPDVLKVMYKGKDKYEEAYNYSSYSESE